MSFIPFNDRGKSGVKIDGLTEMIRSLDAIAREFPQTKRRILQEAANHFVFGAKGRVHVITGRLKKSIKVENVTTEQATIVAETPYAEAEEKRPGIKFGVNTPHAYMLPQSRATSLALLAMIMREIDALLAKNRSL